MDPATSSSGYVEQSHSRHQSFRDDFDPGGNGTAAFSGDGGTAASASLAFPTALAFDALAISISRLTEQSRAHAQRRQHFNPRREHAAKVRGRRRTDGNSLNEPTYVIFDTAGNMFFSDTQNSRVRRVDATTRAITTVVGNAVAGNGGMGWPATSAQIACRQAWRSGKMVRCSLPIPAFKSCSRSNRALMDS